MRSRYRELISILTATTCAIHLNVLAQFTPVDVGQVVTGFQDDFTGAVRDANWIVTGAGGDLYEQGNGVLKVTVIDTDPNHLLYQGAGYNDSVQEILARIRVTAFGTGDFPRGGVGVGVSADTSQGINLHFRDSNQDGVSGRQFKLLDDFRAWGPPGLKPAWETNVWYWLRLRQTGSSSGQSNNIFAKAWIADGTVPEPDDWQLTWGRNDRVGFAGIAGSSGGGLGEFEVDYILIKAEGLPNITVAPSAFPNPLYLSITEQPKDTTVGVNQTTSLTVHAGGSSPPTFQWQRAAPGSTAFTDLSGATASVFTTPALIAADDGVKYRAVVSLPGTSTRVNSREAIVSVDSVPPSVVEARTFGDSRGVRVTFSEPIVPPPTEGAFSINNEVNTITAVVPANPNNPNTLELRTMALTEGATYTLKVGQLTDAYGNRMPAITETVIHVSVEVPFEFEQTVNGFQDDFPGLTRNPDWIATPADRDAYTLPTGNGTLTVTGMPGDPNHLLYQAQGYSPESQEVLARIRINKFSSGGNSRAGITVASDPNASFPGEGINLTIVDNYSGTAGREFRLLDDRRAWGPASSLVWADDTQLNLGDPLRLSHWYWLRLRQAGSSSGGSNNISAKVWLADGMTPEPPDWELQWSRDGRTGFAGILGPSNDAGTEFEVDYILIKADGLPSIKVSPVAFSFGPYINITHHPMGAVAQPGQNVTFSVIATGSAQPTFQWQQSNPGTTNFTDVSGANGSSLTLAPTVSDNGRQYRCVIEVPGFSKVSKSATLVTDVVPPTLISARTLGDAAQVTLVFSESVRVPGNASGFSINNGVTVSSVSAGFSETELVLKTTPISLGTNYLLTVSGVSDLYGNAIDANSQIAIDLTVDVPLDFGQTVNGFQDDFTGVTRDPNWVSNGGGGDLYEQANGILRITTLERDPNHLLYEGSYDDSAQEVLVRMKATAFGTGDSPRGGIGVAIGTSDSRGINLHFRDADQDGVAGRQFKLLNDFVAWGPPGLKPAWTNNVWYWLRLRQTASDIVPGTTNIFGKAWLADGTVPEPADWQMSWSQGGRTGLAGIAGSTGGALGEFDVDYILIKASGLPSIHVTASAFTLVPPGGGLRFTSIKIVGDAIVLEWTGTGTLEESTALGGIWSSIAGAASPYTIQSPVPPRFYRLKK